MSSPSFVNTSQGLTVFRSLDLDESEEDVKGSAGAVFFFHFVNTNAAARFVKFYNATAAGTTVGTTTPFLTIRVPPTGSIDFETQYGIPFSTALCVAATTGVADSDTGAPGTNDVIAHIGYA